MKAPPTAATGRCIHFTGVYGPGLKDIPCCAAGVNYREHVGGRGTGWVRKLPCNRPMTGATEAEQIACAKKQLPSPEEITAFETWLTEHTRLVIAARHACADDSKAHGNRLNGVVECPACKGHLGYSIAPSNGHLWGRCETPDCLSWMQ